MILTTARHSIKTGTQLLWKHRDSNLLMDFNGGYIFAGAAQYLTNQPEEFSNVTGRPNVRTDQVRFAGFLQDDFKVRKNLSLSMGLRYLLETDPATFHNFDPRFGVAWSLGGKQSWALKSHVGVFHGQFSSDQAEEIHREDGVERITSLIYKPTYGSPFSNATPIHSERTIAQGISPGTYLLGDVSVEKDLPFGFNVNAQEVFIRFLSDDRTLNINQPLDNDPNGARPLSPNLNILQVQTSGTGRGHGESITLSNYKSKRVQFFLGGLHLNIRDDTDNSSFFQPQSAFTDAGEEVRRDSQSLWQVFGNATITLPWKLTLSGDGYAQGGMPFNITTGSDNNGDGNFNDRPQYAAAGSVANGTNVFATPFGVLTNTGAIVDGIPLHPIQRNLGALPWNFHVDANLQRAFALARDLKAAHPQTLTLNVRSANFLNHTNVASEGDVLGAPQFLVPITADTARRIEGGLRYSF